MLFLRLGFREVPRGFVWPEGTHEGRQRHFHPPRVFRFRRRLLLALQKSRKIRKIVQSCLGSVDPVAIQLESRFVQSCLGSVDPVAIQLLVQLTLSCVERVRVVMASSELGRQFARDG